MNVTLRGVSKRFGETTACDSIDLALDTGEILALLGENGAGKSTLMKILYGVERPDAGTLTLDGRTVGLRSPRDAQALGIGMVFQDFSLVPALSALENVFLAARSLPWLLDRARNARRRALELLAELCPGLDAARPVATLGVAEQQLVELAKVLFNDARLVILDEPTAVLAEPETERLWQRVRTLKAQGRSVVLVTHKLADVEAIADRVVVMRAGKLVKETRDVRDRRAIVAAMLGTELAMSERRSHAQSETSLRVRALSAREGSQELRELTFEVARGEVLGIAGVAGNGQELLGRVLAAVVAPQRGSIELGGTPLRGPADGRIGYLPEHPRKLGTAAPLTATANLLALEVHRSQFWSSQQRSRARALETMQRFDVRPCEPDRPARTFSGGNLQKLVVARELGCARELVIACFPTMGLDVQASARVVTELERQAERGAAVIWISEDLEALLAHADRIAVLYRGELREPRPVEAVSKVELGAWMTGAAA